MDAERFVFSQEKRDKELGVPEALSLVHPDASHYRVMGLVGEGVSPDEALATAGLTEEEHIAFLASLQEDQAAL